EVSEFLEDAEGAAPSQTLAPLERAKRPVVAEPHGRVDVLLGGDALAEREAGLVGDGRAEPGEHERGVGPGDCLELVVREDRPLCAHVRIPGTVWRARLVDVEATACLPAQPARGEQSLVDGARPPARLAE